MSKKEITTEDLLEKYEEEKKRHKEKISNKERFTGNELFNMKSAIEGFEMSSRGEVHKKSGIGDLKGKEHASFKSKISRNLQIIKNELTVVRGLIPELSEEEKERFEKYQRKEEELKENNIGSEAKNRKNITDIKKIELSGNIKIYEAGLKDLKEEYEDILQTVQDIEDEAEEIFSKPICKCDFDLISEDEIPPEVSPNERQMIWPMIFSPKKNKKKNKKEED